MPDTTRPDHTATKQQPPWRALYPFRSNWHDIGGAKLHYIDAGPANADKTLLFVHGNPTWSFHWRRLIEAQAPRRRCIAPDHLGCGLSDLQPRPLRLADHIDNLVELIRTLDLRNLTLVAQDWGGAIGLGALLEERGRFDRIVLFNTGAFPPWFIPRRIRVCRWPILGQWAVQGGNLFSRAALRMTLSRERLEPAVAAGYLAPYHSWQRRGAVYQFVRDIPSGPNHPTWQTLVDIDARLPSLTEFPKLLVWGERDWCFTTACLDKFVGYWPDAEVRRIADAGHWVVEDAPEEVEQSVAEFLTKTSAPTAV